MTVSRRNFLCYVACLPAARFANGPPETRAGSRRSKPDVTASCLLLDFSCTLPESLEGYKVGLAAAGAPFESASSETDETAPLIVVPAASLTDFNQVRWLRLRVEAGAMVLVESGGAFLSRAEFRMQKLLVRSQFGLSAREPVELWERPYLSGGEFNRLPYVDFNWPAEVRVRDFSRVVPLSGDSAVTVATQEKRVVGLKRKLGAGTLVLLGSPMGPHILAGDPEAQRWLGEVLDPSLRSG